MFSVLFTSALVGSRLGAYDLPRMVTGVVTWLMIFLVLYFADLLAECPRGKRDDYNVVHLRSLL